MGLESFLRVLALDDALRARSDAEENVRRFDEAMTHYSAGRHREAADGLEVLADRTPSAAHVQFFLGISELMEDNVSRARSALQRSADSRVNPYADEAHSISRRSRCVPAI